MKKVFLISMMVILALVVSACDNVSVESLMEQVPEGLTDSVNNLLADAGGSLESVIPSGLISGDSLSAITGAISGGSLDLSSLSLDSLTSLVGSGDLTNLLNFTNLIPEGFLSGITGFLGDNGGELNVGEDVVSGDALETLSGAISDGGFDMSALSMDQVQELADGGVFESLMGAFGG